MTTQPWNPNVPHCSAERRYISPEGTDGGGHVQCLTELSPDGSCPWADEHHSAWIESGLSQNDWAASVVAARQEEALDAEYMGLTLAQWRTHQVMLDLGLRKVYKT